MLLHLLVGLALLLLLVALVLNLTVSKVAHGGGLVQVASAGQKGLW